MENECKINIRTALFIAKMFPYQYPFDELMNDLCNKYGTEFVAKCLNEMEAEQK